MLGMKHQSGSLNAQVHGAGANNEWDMQQVTLLALQALEALTVTCRDMQDTLMIPEVLDCFT